MKNEIKVVTATQPLTGKKMFIAWLWGFAGRGFTEEAAIAMCKKECGIED